MSQPFKCEKPSAYSSSMTVEKMTMETNEGQREKEQRNKNQASC